MKKFLSLIFFLLIALNCYSIEYTSTQCQGSLTPYPTPKQKYIYPDSLTPVFINHVGRHGSRYPASDYIAMNLKKNLLLADSIGTITPRGRDFMKLLDIVIAKSTGKWGTLDSLGMSEQRGIAERMYNNYPQLLEKANINAISSYSPRCVMSMYMFTQLLTTKSTNLSITTSEGKKWSYLMRPFDVDTSYVNFIMEKKWNIPYQEYLIDTCPTNVAFDIFGKRFPADAYEIRNLTMNVYYIIAGLQTMGLEESYKPFITLEEYNQLWSIFNLRQYLQRCQTTVSGIPASIASSLIADLVTSADKNLKTDSIGVELRFGHAETLMPLLSLLEIPGCHYLTHYFDTVDENWKDFQVVPMAANIQFIYFKSKNGTIYVRTELNEIPIFILPNSNDLYPKWEVVREYLLSKITPIAY